MKNGKAAVRWKKRGGETVVAEATADGKKCRVRSPMWWIEYVDHQGIRRRVEGSRIRAAAEHKMSLIVQDVERQRGGLPPTQGSAAAETIASKAAEYRDHLKDLGREPKHYTQVYTQITDVARDCKWVLVRDIAVPAWVRWVGAQRQDADGRRGLAADTINHYLRSLRAFLRWAKAGQLLADAELLNAEADRRHFRRVLAPADFRRLIDSTRMSTAKRVYLDGPSRAALYLFAGRTGFRAGVLAKLAKADVRLDDPTPHIPTSAKRQKSRKALAIPLSDAFVAELRAWLDSRPAGPLWPGNWHRHNHSASMLRRDLRAAGIPEETEEGTYDFHSLRGQCATDLALAGVPLHVTQQFLGHSTPTLTAKHYLRVGLGDLAAAAGKVT